MPELKQISELVDAHRKLATTRVETQARCEQWWYNRHS